MTANDQALILSAPQTNTVVTNDIRTIREPVRGIRTPFKSPVDGFTIFEFAAGMVILALIAVLFVRHLRHRDAPHVRVVPPHERARLRLAQALRLIDDPYCFCSEVSDAIRVYLEERFAFRAPDRTTEEFLNELQSTQLLTPKQKESLAAFLNQCDLAKFARHVPTETELRELHTAALHLVSETEPAPLAGIAPAPMPANAS